MSRFLFKAYFADGTVYEQGEADTSLYHPEKSSFFDVLVLSKEENGVMQNPILRFELTNGTNTYAVNLGDGSFELNGLPFFMMNCPEISEHLPLVNYRLIFFKRITKVFNPAMLHSYGERCMYNFGWQANDAFGNNKKQIMTILE